MEIESLRVCALLASDLGLWVEKGGAAWKLG